jgi:uncharacterized protein YkwD
VEATRIGKEKGARRMNIPNFNGNWVDLVIAFVVLFFIFEGLRSGFWAMLVDFFAFLTSLLLSLRLYLYSAAFLRANFDLGRSLSNALGFLLTAIVLEATLGFLLALLLTSLPEKLREAKWSRLASIVPAVGEAIVLIAFVLTLVVSFPVSPGIKKDVSDSEIGGYLIQKTSGIEARLSEVFGGVIEDSLTYFTIQPGSTQRVEISVEKQVLRVDEEAETQMFDLVNEERKKRGVAELTWRSEVVPIARNHAQDMWERKYFGHVSPEGQDVGGRLDEAGVSYTFAGENLALAPTVTTAHNGLMNSEGHRENILEERFTHMGIGVIDNGVNGKMFVQVFTD